MTKWTGLFPALTTKLTQDGKVDLKATKDSIGRLVDNGVSGVIVLPMLGENASMTPGEREAIIRGAVETVAGRVPVLSGLAEVTLDNARANAKLYESYGAQGLMVFPSLGYRTDARETAEWYKGIAQASALPIMIYNNPIAYGVDVTVDILRDLVDTPEIVYQSLKRELRGLPQFFWQPWNQAATTLLTSKVHLDEAMVWVDRSIAIQKNFANSLTKARLLGERGDAAGAKKLMDEALPGANEAELNAYGYQLLGGGSAADAVAIFRENVKRHPESWNAHDSLAEGLVGLGRTDEAVAMYRKALAMAPEAQKGRIQGILDGLGKKP